MSVRLAPVTLLYLTLPPLMWASNAIVGRLSVAGGEPLISPLTLNAARWVVTLLILAGIPVWWIRERISARAVGRTGPR